MVQDLGRRARFEQLLLKTHERTSAFCTDAFRKPLQHVQQAMLLGREAADVEVGPEEEGLRRLPFHPDCA